MVSKLLENDTESNLMKHFKSLGEFKKLEELPNTKPFVLVNSEGTIVYANKSFEKYFKLFENNTFKDLNSDPKLHNLIQNLIKSNYSSFHTELIVLKTEDENAEEHYVDIERVFITDQEYFVIIFTSRKERERIEERINNLHNALEYGDVPVIITDNRGIINYASKSFEEILNQSLEELYHNNLQTVFIQYLTDEDIDSLEEALEKGEKWVKLISDINEDGGLWFKEIKLNPVKKGNSNVTNFIITANDITNHILKNRLFRKSEQRQKSIINNISDLLLIFTIKNNELIFENFNDNFVEEFELDKSEILKQPGSRFLPEGLCDAIKSTIEELNGSSENDTKHFRFKDELLMKTYMGKISFTVDPYENEKLYILIMQDITEQLLNEERLRRAYEKETKLNKLKSAFLANMSHEIRTPLNAIVGYSDLLEDEINSGDKESVLEITNFLKEGVQRLLNLVDNIVEVSMLESGEQKFDLGKYRVDPLIRNTYESMYESVVRNGLTFELELNANDTYINTDEEKFRKILDMLIDNAIKYNNSNGKIVLRTYRLADLVRIEVEDTGIGIDEEKIHEIIEPFTQQEAGYKRNFEGAGLGLTIAYKLTKELGGTLDIKSEVEKGTNVILTFPVA